VEAVSLDNCGLFVLANHGNFHLSKIFAAKGRRDRTRISEQRAGENRINAADIPKLRERARVYSHSMSF
jgi:hypothetical protein